MLVIAKAVIPTAVSPNTFSNRTTLKNASPNVGASQLIITNWVSHMAVHLVRLSQQAASSAAAQHQTQLSAAVFSMRSAALQEQQAESASVSCMHVSNGSHLVLNEGQQRANN